MKARVFLCAVLLSSSAFAQSGQDVAMSLRPNTVRIEAQLGDQTENGFGFIVAEGNGILYAVTANHVVAQKEPDAPPAKVRVELFGHQGDPIEAKLLGTRDVSHDIAVITFEPPDGFHWNVRSLSTEARPKNVWFIGRSGKWFVPTDPGHVSDEMGERMEIESLGTLRPGTSGGPLVSTSGIVGMLVTDSADGAQAVSIGTIKSAFTNWGHPWTAQPMTAMDLQAIKGAGLAAADPLTSALREQQPNAAARYGFDVGMVVADGQSEWGPGKQRMLESFPQPEQQGFEAATKFLVDRNHNAARAALGARIAEQDSAAALARKKENDARYWLGFDIATAIFGDPKLGAQGNTATGPGSLGIRDSLFSPAAKRGFDDAVKFHLSKKY